MKYNEILDGPHRPNGLNAFANRGVGGLMGLVVAVIVLVALPHIVKESRAGDDDKPAPQPVEKNMHEFMEYVFEPGYKRLREVMAQEPTANDQWKAIKGDSLALAEGSNLLLMRSPDEGRADWDRFSVAVRQDGTALYQAARAKDFEAAKKHYVTMLGSCNRCHDQFAGGKHQLKP